MIEGLKVDITASELIAHLRERAAHHDERRLFYIARANDLDKGIAADESADLDYNTFSNSNRGDPRQQLRQAAQDHAQRQAHFTFLADHIVGSEVYRLSEADFIKLEFVSKYL